MNQNIGRTKNSVDSRKKRTAMQDTLENESHTF